MGDSFLTEWIKHFLKSRDAVFRTLETISRHDKYDLHIKHKDREQVALCRARFDEHVLKSLETDREILLVGFNTEENFQFILNNWKELSIMQGLTIYMVNPESETETKWIVKPFVHNRICEDGALEQGLRAMYDTVEVLTPHKVKGMQNRQQMGA
jgi:hypothetical protein